MELDVETSNQLFEVLEDWNHVLKAENISASDFKRFTP